MSRLIYEWLYIGAGIFGGLFLFKKALCKDCSREEGWSKGWLLVALGAILIGGYLRIAGITFGLPNHFHPDEIRKAQIISRMAESGDLNPHYFLHPTLLLYLSLVIDKLFIFLFGGSAYEWAFVSGRLVSSVAGTASIYLVFILGKELRGVRTGAIASSLFSLFPLHVTISRYLKEDSLLLFLFLLSSVLIFDGKLRRKKSLLLLGALVLGLSIATKYTGALGLVLLCFIETKMLLLAQVAVLTGFLLGTPFSILDFSSFIGGVLYEKEHALRGHTESISAWSELWLYHWSRSIKNGVTPFVSYLFLVCVGFSIRSRWKVLLLPTIFFFYFYLPAEWVPSKPAPQPERYIALTLPCIALLIGAVGSIVMAKKNYLLPVLLIIVIAWSVLAWKSVVLYENLAPDTRELASQWIEQNIPKSSRIVLDFEPYAPPIASDYTILNNPLLPVSEFVEVQKLQTMQADYIILSSLSYDRFFTQPNQSVVERVKYRNVFSRLESVKTFENPSGRYGFHNPVIRILRVPKP